MEIYLPEEMKEWEGDLHFFIDIMVRKLHLNRHKGFIWAEKTDLAAQLSSEIQELSIALKAESQFGIAVECADVANQAFLLALSILRKTRKEFDNDRHIRSAVEASAPFVHGAPMDGSTYAPKTERS